MIDFITRGFPQWCTFYHTHHGCKRSKLSTGPNTRYRWNQWGRLNPQTPTPTRHNLLAMVYGTNVFFTPIHPPPSTIKINNSLSYKMNLVVNVLNLKKTNYHLKCKVSQLLFFGFFWQWTLSFQTPTLVALTAVLALTLRDRCLPRPLVGDGANPRALAPLIE